MNKEKNVEFVDLDESKEIVICGDIHGQYYDLLNIFNEHGYPSENKHFLFNGDFVDRGSFSIEVMIALMAFKTLTPKCLYLNRGNHEAWELNTMYGFEGEVVNKYCSDTFLLFLDLFKHLPIAHVVNQEIFVVHGGLS